MENHGHGIEGRMTSTEKVCQLEIIKKKINLRKQSVPMTKRSAAMATNNGPAAPVSLSPQRSRRLKQAKTKRGQPLGMAR